MVVTMLKNRVIHVFYIQIKFIIKFTHLHVFIAQRNLLSGHASYKPDKNEVHIGKQIKYYIFVSNNIMVTTYDYF